MYTKNELHTLRDLLAEKVNTQHDYRSGWATVDYIYDALTIFDDPTKLQENIAHYASRVKGIHLMSEEVDYGLAYDLLFGDISVVPLHINDIFELISVWRLKSPNAIDA